MINSKQLVLVCLCGLLIGCGAGLMLNNSLVANKNNPAMPTLTPTPTLKINHNNSTYILTVTLPPNTPDKLVGFYCNDNFVNSVNSINGTATLALVLNDASIPDTAWSYFV